MEVDKNSTDKLKSKWPLCSVARFVRIPSLEISAEVHPALVSKRYAYLRNEAQAARKVHVTRNRSLASGESRG